MTMEKNEYQQITGDATRGEVGSNPPSQEQLIEFVRALAVSDARRDHERATNPKKKSPAMRILTPSK